MKMIDYEPVMDDGTKYYANGGIIGLGPDLCISEGYDGGIDNSWSPIPPAHRKEIAAYMIEQWTRVLNGEQAK